MVQGEPSVPVRRPGDLGSQACLHATARIASFLVSDRPLAQERELSAHLAICSTCNDGYREALLMASRAARTRRLARLESARLQRRQLHRRLAFEAAGGQRGSRGARLRLLLAPALLVFLLVNVFPGAPARQVARLLRLEGQVEVDQFVMTPEGAPIGLLRGDWCRTGEGSRARIDLGAVQLTLGPLTRLLVEDEREGRFRLDTGELLIAGPCVLTSLWGVVEVGPGQALVRVVEGGLEVESTQGVHRLSNGLGRQEVAAGHRALLTLGQS